MPGRVISNTALKINGHTLDQIKGYPSPGEFVSKIQRKLGTYVDRHNTADKFIPMGYNVKFDIDFIRSTFDAMDAKYWGSFVANAPIDVWSLVGLYVLKTGIIFPKYTLGVVCKILGVPLLNAHDPMADIIATRALYYHIMDKLDIPTDQLIVTPETHPDEFSEVRANVEEVAKEVRAMFQ